MVIISSSLLLSLNPLASQLLDVARARASNSGLTTAAATIIAASCTAIAVLAVGVLNVLTQRKQLKEQRELLERQLEAQREQSNAQLEAQREQTNRQLTEQRDLRRIELESEVAKINREEKKAAYIRMLAGCREVEVTWELVASQHPASLIANLDSMLARLTTEREAMRAALAEIELLGSPDVVKLVTLFTERSGNLLAAFVNKSELAIKQSGQPTLSTLSEAQKAVREEIVKQETTRIFYEMQETMRREILGETTEPSSS
jgi:hypothetical protein